MPHWYQDAGMGAEYRFVPLAKKVEPSPVQLGGNGLSHSKPVPGGFSGQLKLDLIAETPVLFGKARKIGGKDIVAPARLHEGEDAPYVMPPNAVRGMLRSLYRIATFSAFNPINRDHVFASRTPEYLEYITELGRFGIELPRVQGRPERPKADKGWLTFEVDANGELSASVRKAPGMPVKIATSELGKAVDDPADRTLLNRAINKGAESEAKRNNRDLRDDPLKAKIVETRLTYENQNQVTAKGYSAFWHALDLNEKTKLIRNRWREVAAVVNRANTADGAFLSVTGSIATKNAEACFYGPAQDAEKLPLSPDTLAKFLFAASEYAKTGAPFPIGGKRTLRKDSFRAALIAWALPKNKAEWRIDVLQRLGIIISQENDDEWHPSQWRFDKPPGVPVHFYTNNDIQEGVPGLQTEVLFLGTPEMFRIGHRFSVGDVAARKPMALIGRTLDWTEALFGAADSDDGEDERLKKNLGSRLRFHFGAASEVELLAGKDNCFVVTQGAPKASYDPFYLSATNPLVTENGQGPIWKDLPAWDSKNVELNGHKRYPAVFTFSAGDLGQPVSVANAVPDKMSNLVQPLKEGCRFTIVMDFKNLHPLELGALVWCLTFGDHAVLTGEDSVYRHVAGRLRNKGLGRLKPANFDFSALKQNPLPEGFGIDCGPAQSTKNAQLFMAAFEAEMGDRLWEAAVGGVSCFYQSEPITALCNLSDSTWTIRQEEGHQVGGMRHYPRAGGQTDFKPFVKLRKALYKRNAPFTSPGHKTVLTEFLKPKALPQPDQREVLDFEKIAVLRDPASALKEWQMKQPKAGSF
jgi:CRISPR-associated protein (TIGR03986 family)